MKLYELERGDYFRLAGDDNSPVYRLYRLDGMYSLCYNKHGKIVHFAAHTPVIRVTNQDDQQWSTK